MKEITYYDSSYAMLHLLLYYKIKLNNSWTQISMFISGITQIQTKILLNDQRAREELFYYVDKKQVLCLGNC